MISISLVPTYMVLVGLASSAGPAAPSILLFPGAKGSTTKLSPLVPPRVPCRKVRKPSVAVCWYALLAAWNSMMG